MRPYYPCVCSRHRNGCAAFVLLVLALIILLANGYQKVKVCDEEFIGDEDDFEDK